MKKLTLMAALLAVGMARAQDVVVTQNIEEHTLPGGSKVTIENNTRILYQETKQQKVNAPARRVAIFIENNAGPEYNAAMPALLAQIKARASGRNFEIIDFRNAVMAMRPLPDALKTAEGVAQTRRVQELQAAMNRLQGNAEQKNLGGQGTTVDDKLLAQTSFVTLAQNLGADYLMIVSVNPFDQEQNEANKITAYSANISYELTDFGGYAIGGDIVEARLLERGLQDRPYTPNLLTKIATDLAKNMNDNAQAWRVSSLEQSKIPVTFDAQAMTMDSQPLFLPKFALDERQVALESQMPVRVAALVEVDGVAVGTTDCTVPIAPGLRKVRVFRDGLDDVTMTINAFEGLKLVVPMRITEGEMRRVQELQKFIVANTAAGILTEAAAEKIKGEAEMLRNSHVRIDATNLPDTHVYQTLVPGNTVVPVINNTTTVVQ